MKDQDNLDQTSSRRGGETNTLPRQKPLDEKTQLFQPYAPPLTTPSPEGLQKPLLDDAQATVAFKPFKDFKKEEPAVQPTIEVVSGQANQKVFNLGREEIKIGRSKYNDVVLDDEKVSRSHA
ncbi:MAG: FHA domain-containing protein, partial [Desulfobacterota bacterium]|nr:FHA domain-containing protein [Thermodesulfobacteriota bacterium]